MTQPWLLFLAVALGLLSGGGIEVIAAPTAWLTAGMDAPKIIRAQQCAIETLAAGAANEGPSQ